MTREYTGNEVAIVGIGCRFPHSPDWQTFWANLIAGRELISFFSRDELLASGVEPHVIDHPAYVPAKAALEHADCFDHEAFGFSPREAAKMDPQLRILHEVAAAAFADASVQVGIQPLNTGVFLGTTFNLGRIEQFAGSSGDIVQMFDIGNYNDPASFATQLAYRLRLVGPAVNVQTACSTSLAAVHLACRALLAGECDLALAGGACITDPVAGGYIHQDGMILSRDGRCRPFSDEADGTVNGNGAALILLKLLDQALVDGDPIHAIIAESAMNNDGDRKVSFEAPSVVGQADAIAQVYRVAGVPFSSLGMIEAHGTATSLGDPIEIQALRRVAEDLVPEDELGRFRCAIGSVKSNMGHLDTAAGIAGLVKAALSVRFGRIPASLHFDRPNPHLQLEQTPFHVPRTATTWPEDRLVRRAGVSSFGIGGTNIHMLVEQAPPTDDSDSRVATTHGPAVLPLSAASFEALARTVDAHARHLDVAGNGSLDGIARQLQHDHRTGTCRAAFVTPSHADWHGQLSNWSLMHHARPRDDGQVWLFAGQGTQVPGIGLALADAYPGFATIYRPLLGSAAAMLGVDTQTLLDSIGHPANAPALHLQPATYCMQAALGSWLKELGMSPSAVCGFSLGEFAAAATAELFSVEDGVALVVARAQLMEQAPRGAVFAVSARRGLPEPLPANTWRIAELSPGTWTLATAEASTPALERWLALHDLAYKRVPVALPFHTPLVDDAARAFGEVMAKASLRAPRLRVVSTLTGLSATADMMTDPSYWVDQMRTPVRWAEAIGQIGAEGGTRLLVQVGPGTDLLQHARKWLSLPADRVAPSLGARAGEEEVAATLRLIARGWENGQDVNWEKLNPPSVVDVRPDRVHLPGPAFRRRSWPDQNRRGAPVPLRTLPMGDHVYGLEWHRFDPEVEPLGGDARRFVWILCRQVGEVERRLGKVMERAGHPLRFVPCTKWENNGEVVTDTLAQWLLDQGLDKDAPTDILVTGLLDDLAPVAVRFWAFWLPIELARWTARSLPARPLRIVFPARGLAAPDRADTIAPEKRQLLGPLLLVPEEFPSVQTLCVDVSDGDPETMVQALTPWLQSGWTGACSCAYREGGWWRQRVTAKVQATPVSQTIASIQRSSWVLVTGAQGGMGRAIADHLARVHHCNLLLLVRGPLPPQTEWDAEIECGGKAAELLQWVGELRAHAGRVEVLQADMGDVERLEAAFAPVFALASHGDGIDYVFHAAGRGEGALMQLRSDSESILTLAPKVEGTRFLCENRQRLGSPTLLLFSSLGNLLPREKVGQVAYVAANACLEAFAEQVRTEGGRALAIAWDDWAEAGMARRSAGVLDETLSRVSASASGRHWRLPLDAASQWWLDEHRLDPKNAVMPAMALVALIHQALAALGEDRRRLVHDFTIRQPVLVRDGEPLDLVMSFNEDWDGFSIHSGTGEYPSDDWVRHADGGLSVIDDAEPFGALPDTGHPRETLFQSRDGEGVSPRGALRFGPRWCNVVTVERAGPGRIVNHLALPAAYRDETAQMPLHVALLDTATLIGSPERKDGEWAPLAIARFAQLAPLTSQVRSEVSVRETGTSRALDVRIHSPDGELLVAIDGLLLVDSSAALQRHGRASEATHDVLRLDRSDAAEGPLRLVACREPRREPGASEVEIRVHAAGLNFKDVLIALGVLPAPADPAMTFGQETAGVVTRIGAEVHGFAVGDRVMAAGHSCLAEHVLMPHDSVASIPSTLGYREAAGIPVAFTTAWLALRHAASLQRGERVLVHAAAGGVGLAAVQIALHLGAEVWATAGSEAKRQLLLRMGVRGVANSRTVQFADDFRSALGERPFDVVLNSLAGELMASSLTLLAPQGRFLELGLRDILEDAPLGLAIFATGGSFHAVQAGSDHPRYRQAWEEIVDLLDREVLTPLPVRAFPAAEAGEAFQFMAQARHVGKIVIEMPQAPPKTSFAHKLQRDGLTTRDGVAAAMTMAALANATDLPYLALSRLPIGQVLESQSSTQQMLFGAAGDPSPERGAVSDQPSSLRDVGREQLLSAMQVMLSRFLGVEHVDPDAGFFDLGATSLDLIQFAKQLEQRLERDLPVATLFGAVSLRRLADELAPVDETPVRSAGSAPQSADGRRRAVLARRQLRDEPSVEADASDA